jgi:hypothetical protein
MRSLYQTMNRKPRKRVKKREKKKKESRSNYFFSLDSKT